MRSKLTSNEFVLASTSFLPSSYSQDETYYGTANTNCKRAARTITQHDCDASSRATA